MNWYVARIVFKIVTGKLAEVEQYDETLRVIMASSLEEAILKARTLGIQEEEFSVCGKDKTRWEFVNIASINQIKELRDGVEIYSTVTEHKREDAYESVIHAKAESLHYLAATQ
ncbi:MAG: DUF4288 domain-containing protein [Cyclobacteriaceae bacterium]|jgi:hypothetical protein|nr:DUF4288 domain-containing protein [Cyclobacteriaceae bacterium]